MISFALLFGIDILNFIIHLAIAISKKRKKFSAYVTTYTLNVLLDGLLIVYFLTFWQHRNTYKKIEDKIYEMDAEYKNRTIVCHNSTSTVN